MKRNCVQCGKEFTLTDSELAFYKDKGLSVPKRCKECRAANRKTKAGMNKSDASKNYNKDITVDTVTKKQSKSPEKKSPSFALLLVALVVVVIGAVSVFLSGNKSDTSSNTYEGQNYSGYSFSSEEALEQHFYKHGSEFGYSTKEEYLQGAINVIENPDSLKKTEMEDGDIVYYLKSTNEIVFVSPSGTIRTYFRPDDGIDYFNRQQVTIFRFIA